MTDGLSVYTPDERGRFVHKAEYDGHGWKMRDLKGLMLTHPEYEIGEFHARAGSCRYVGEAVDAEAGAQEIAAARATVRFA